MNVKKSKVILFKRAEAQVIDFATPFRMRVEVKRNSVILPTLMYASEMWIGALQRRMRQWT